MLGVLRGMCNELYELYDGFEEKKTNIVASGGGVRHNEVLKRLIADRFGASVSVNATNEEAAMARLFLRRLLWVKRSIITVLLSISTIFEEVRK